jgi:hypothetical protein
MGFQARLCFFFLLLTFAVMCFAREAPLGMLIILCYSLIVITMAAGIPICVYIYIYMTVVACLQGVKRIWSSMTTTVHMLILSMIHPILLQS